MALLLKQTPAAPAGEPEGARRSGRSRTHYRQGEAVHRIRPLRLVLALLAVVLIAAAGVVRFAVLPAAAKLPANTNTTNVYTGTAKVLLNEAALTPGSKAPLLLSNLPLQINETVRVLRSNSSGAVVDYRVTGKAAGTALPAMDNRYAVDRTTLEPTTSISGPGLTAARGLTVSFPIGTGRHDYTGWVQDTGLTTLLRFAGTATSVPVPSGSGTRSHALGFQAYVFQQKTPPAPITDPQELASLPRGVPTAEIPALLVKLHLPASTVAQFAPALAKLGKVLPLEYTYAATYTYWVSPRDGVVVDLEADETRAVELPASVLGVTVPIATVSQFVYTDSPSTLRATIQQAKNDSFDLTLLGTALPLGALVVGLVLLLVAAVFVRRRRPGEAVPSERLPPANVPVGQGSGI